MTGPTRPEPGPGHGDGRPARAESGRHAVPVPAEAQPQPAPAGPAASAPLPPVAPSSTPVPSVATSRYPGWVAPAALALAVIGTLLSLWAIKTASDNAPGVKLAGDSKVRVCSAFATVSKAVSLQTHGGAEPLPEALAATNSRQALLAGGQYLLQQIDAKTPKDLTTAVTGFANDIQTLGLNYLGGAASTETVQAELIKRADAGMTNIADLCK